MKIHVVQKGETLWEIAQQYNVDFEELKQANSQLSSPDMIMPGMKIKVPSTTKTVKKEVPKKEKQVKHKKEKQESVPHKPIPVIEEDEKEKKIEVKPEMPLPQIPEKQQIPEYSMMQMPEMQQEMNHYTMINMPQMPPMQHMETEKKEKPPKKKETKEKVETTYDIPPELPHHLHTPVQPTMEAKPTEQPGQHMAPPMPAPAANMPFPHMYPVCCHVVPPCCHQIMPMVEGQMHGGHPMPYSHPPLQTGGDCGCTEDQAKFYDTQGGYPYPTQEQGQMMGEMHLNPNHSQHFNQQEGYHSPHLFTDMNEGKTQAPPQHMMNHYPTPPPFRDEEDE